MMESYITSIHHVGIVVRDIKEKSKIYIDQLGYKKESEIILEEFQKVYVQFLSLNNYTIELIMPESELSPVYRFLENNGHINHLCYTTNDIEKTILYFRKEYGALLTCPPVEGGAVDGRKIAFLAKADGEIIELIEINE